MESKMYYTDYLKAAIMSRDFGVNFILNEYKATIDIHSGSAGYPLYRLLEDAPSINRLRCDAVRVYGKEFYIHRTKIWRGYGIGY